MPTSSPRIRSLFTVSRVLLALSVALVLPLGACGGEASGNTPDPGGQGGSTSGQGSRAPLCGSASFYELDDTASACPWLYAGWCFDEREDACTCACGREKGDTCISGFPGDRVDVSCPFLGE
ncbi:MAG: hypothetical protein R3B07_31470 [Polyangiaceae bacterium]